MAKLIDQSRRTAAKFYLVNGMIFHDTSRVIHQNKLFLNQTQIHRCLILLWKILGIVQKATGPRKIKEKNNRKNVIQPTVLRQADCFCVARGCWLFCRVRSGRFRCVDGTSRCIDVEILCRSKEYSTFVYTDWLWMANRIHLVAVTLWPSSYDFSPLVIIFSFFLPQHRIGRSSCPSLQSDVVEQDGDVCFH